MSLESADRLGPYEIVCPIGKGGMGEVYRARDTRSIAMSRPRLSAASSGSFWGIATALAARSGLPRCS